MKKTIFYLRTKEGKSVSQTFTRNGTSFIVGGSQKMNADDPGSGPSARRKYRAEQALGIKLEWVPQEIEFVSVEF